MSSNLFWYESLANLKLKKRMRRKQEKKISLKAWLSNKLFILSTGIHPTIISESFQKALDKGIEVLNNMAQPVELSDRETLLNSATTSLNSKVWLILQLCTSRLAEPFKHWNTMMILFWNYCLSVLDFSPFIFSLLLNLLGCVSVF